LAPRAAPEGENLMSVSAYLAGVACAVTVLVSAAVAEDKSAAAGKYWVFAGTYTGPKSKGIYRFELDTATGGLSGGDLVAEANNPSFLAIHPSRRFLYAVSEVGDFGGKRTGAVSGFTLDPATGRLSALNSVSSGGDGPCHLVVDAAGKHVLVANYGGGNASVVSIDSDGRLGKQTAFVQHNGSSVNKARQEGPHAHSINLDPANHFAVVADLGIDKVMVYKYDSDKGTLAPASPPFVATAAGAGPRHFAFHPSAPLAYVINELDCTVLPFSYDAHHGVLTPLKSVSTLPVAYRPEYSTAEVQVHPSGRFLYGSNRGHDTIAIFAIDPKTGALTASGHQAAGIKTPRNFGIDPTGRFLIVANQDSASLVVFRIDQQTGALTPTGQRVAVPTPVCVKFVARE
jgi:6-phosphogluconolactonase